MGNKRRRLIVSLLLVAATIAVYGQVAGHPFIHLDDDVHVYDNYHVKTGLSWRNIVWAFEIRGPSQWHPLAWFSHQLDCELFGLNPAAHHLVNLLLHLASALVLLTALDKMTGAFWPSALVAALFALHPLNVQSVAWVSERRDVLSTFFLMLTLASYSAYARRGGLGRYLLVVVCFALGLMSKPMLVTAPFVLLLLDIWPLGRLRLAPANAPTLTSSTSERPSQPIAWLVTEKVPMLALSAVSSVLTVLCQHSIGAMPSLQHSSLSTRAANASLSYVAYLRKMVWPSDLALYYPYRETFPALQVAGAVLFLLVITLAVLRLLRRRPYLAVGWFWYLGTLVPVIGLVQAGDHAMADRFTYIPLIGVYVMIAWAGADLVRPRMERRELRVALGLAAGIVLASLAACTWAQTRHWRSSVALFEHAIRVTTNTATMSHALGNAYDDAGKLDLALTNYTTALELNPTYVMAYAGRGNTYRQLGQYDLAVAEYTRAIQLRPDLAVAYSNRGATYGQLGHYDLAIRDCTRAIELVPRRDDTYFNRADAYYNRAGAYDLSGQHQQALADFTQAIERKPDYVPAYFQRADVYRKLGRREPAIADYTMVIELDPQNAKAYYERANVHGQLGHYDLAAADYTRAIELRPGDAPAYYNRGNAHHRRGRYDEAIADFTRTIELKPEDPAPYAIRAASYHAKGQRAEARADVEHVHQLGGQVPPDLNKALAEVFP